jgi:hypothetical protein
MNQIKKIAELPEVGNFVSAIVPLKHFSLLCSRKEAEAASNFCPHPEPHKNDAAPQHLFGFGKIKSSFRCLQPCLLSI